MATTTTESFPSSRLRFFAESGEELPSPLEGSRCGIVIDIPKDFWPHTSLKCGDFLLEIVFDEKANIAYAMWPECRPGYYELALECGDYRERRVITVMPNHFTESDLTYMVHELTELLPKSIVTQLAAAGAQLGANLTLNQAPTLEDEYLKLHAAIAGTRERPGLLQILPRIQRECHQVLIPKTAIRDANKVRRPDISRLPQIMTMPGNVLTEKKVFQMFDVTFEHSYDTYENRLVKEYIKALRSRLSRLQTQMSLAPPAMASGLEALIAEFNLACMRATFLREVKLASTFMVRITMVLLKNQAYRAVFEDYLALNQQSSGATSVRLEEAALSNPLNEFAFLYDLWANLKVLNALLQVAVESGYQCVSHHWIKKFNTGIFIQVMNDQHAAIELVCPTTGRRVTLVTWRPQGGSEALAADTSNQNRLMALAVNIEAPKKPPVILLFDPEYRVTEKPVVEKTAAKKSKAKSGKKRTVKPTMIMPALKVGKGGKIVEPALTTIEPMQEDIDEIQRCIDLVTTPVGTRPIRYAAILCPGQKKELAPGLEALSARPSDGDTLHKDLCDVLRTYLR